MYYAIDTKVLSLHPSISCAFQKIIKNHKLRESGQGQHQTYALGIKEVCRNSLIPFPSTFIISSEQDLYVNYIVFAYQLPHYTVQAMWLA
jgi:hypothetical protein